MGWFDKKSWQKRRKIKDLQADLIRAEREGKYVVEQGLFFAELQDMGEATMMLFGAGNELSGSEEGIIKSFFDRNGFTVEVLKMDRSLKVLTEVEIIPPEEVTRWVGRYLKAEGYRLIDDSEEVRPAELARQIFPLSALVRGIIILFAERVQTIILTTGIKMNKEGNRLLQWMPKIAACLHDKVAAEVVDVLREPFEDAYSQFFLRVGPGSGKDGREASPAPQPEDDQSRIPGMMFPQRTDTPVAAAPAPHPNPVTPKWGIEQQVAQASSAFSAPQRPGAENAPSPAILVKPPATNVLAGSTASFAGEAELLHLNRALEASEVIGRMYKSLIRANPSRCVSNSEALLQEINKLFHASATCLMVEVPNGEGLTIHAQAGKQLLWSETPGEGFPVSSTVLGNCIRQRTVVTDEESGGDPTASMIAHQINATAAAPIFIKDEIVGIIYLDRRGGLRPFTEEECETLIKVAQVFREFPDLTLGLV